MIDTVNGRVDPIKDRELFNRIAKKYFSKDLNSNSIKARKHRLNSSLDKTNIKKFENICEIGCGGGFSAKYLEGRYANYTGVDYADSLVDYAKEFHASPTIKYVASDLFTFRPNEKYDLVFMIGVLHHLDRPVEALIHLKSLLKPGGLLIVNEPQSTNIIIELMRKIRKRFDDSYSSDQVTFSPKEICDLFEKAGYKNIKLFPQGFFSTPFAEVITADNFLYHFIVKSAVNLDRMLGKVMSNKFGHLFSWNTVAIGKLERNP